MLKPVVIIRLSSPHAWGCFSRNPFRLEHHSVFPTCVGVFLHFVDEKSRGLSLPHMRGGVSIFLDSLILIASSSPHAWGCFLKKQREIKSVRVFPTCVGVFLLHYPKYRTRFSLPHMRGGVS